MKKFILTGFLAISSMMTFAQTIADARNMGIGQTVTVRGISANGSELGNIRYLQDGTAAIPAFGNSLISDI